jgi:hypothetical protein
MPNMSYCRFENTLKDLRDCYDALSENGFEDLSESERRYAIRMVQMCKAITEDFIDEVEDAE